jgi:hypothetical protein
MCYDLNATNIGQLDERWLCDQLKICFVLSIRTSVKSQLRKICDGGRSSRIQPYVVYQQNCSLFGPKLTWASAFTSADDKQTSTGVRGSDRAAAASKGKSCGLAAGSSAIATSCSVQLNSITI